MASYALMFLVIWLCLSATSLGAWFLWDMWKNGDKVVAAALGGSAIIALPITILHYYKVF